MLRKFVLIFFNDILVFSPSWEEHLCHLRSVFEILNARQLFVKMSKCAFGCVEVDYLGHRVSGKGVAVDPDKIQA